MSHFTIGIIVPPDYLDDPEGYAEIQLAPFDENIKVAPYVCYSLEKAQQDLDRDRRYMTQVIESRNPAFNLERCQERLAELRQMNAEQKYSEYISGCDRLNRRGEPLSTYNPNSKWDWYTIGGRWDGWLYDRETNRESLDDNLAPIAHVLEQKLFPFALVTPDGVWHEQGQMGWWGIVLDDTGTEAWHTQATEILKQFADHSLLLIDAHI